MSSNHRMRMRRVALAVWSRRMAIFYAISVASLAGNFVVLAASLEVWSGVAVLLHMLLPQLIELFELLMHRPVLYILLNLILLRIVVKSGVLGGGPSKKLELDAGGFPGINRLQRPQLLVGGGLHGELNHGVERSPGSQHKHNRAVEAAGNEQMSTSVPFLKKQASMVFTVAEADPSAKEAALSAVDLNLPRDEADQKPVERWIASIKEPAKADQLPKRRSLFTIEPLEMVTEPPATLMGAGLAVGLHATLVGAGQQDMDEIYMSIIKADSAEAGGTQTGTMATPNQNLVTERRLINGGADGRPDDHELSRQEFNQRVDTFISKFKRNLTMQRQDSLNRLVGLLA